MKDLNEYYKGQPTGIKDKHGQDIKFGDLIRCDKEQWYYFEIYLGKNLDDLPEPIEKVEFDFELLDQRQYEYPNYWEIV